MNDDTQQDDEGQLDFIGLAEEKGQHARVVMKVSRNQMYIETCSCFVLLCMWWWWLNPRSYLIDNRRTWNGTN